MESRKEGGLRSGADTNPCDHAYTSLVDSLVHSECSVIFDELTSRVTNSSRVTGGRIEFMAGINYGDFICQIQTRACSLKTQISFMKAKYVRLLLHWTFDPISVSSCHHCKVPFAI